MTNNFINFFPIIIPPNILPNTKVFVRVDEKTVQIEPIAKGQRPYRVVIASDGTFIPEWMWNPRDGTTFRTPWNTIKKEYLEKGKVIKYFLQGVRATYALLKDGSFQTPYTDKTLSILVNDLAYKFDDVYPYAKYVVQARIIMDDKRNDSFDYVGIGWRKILPLPDGRDVDLTVTLLVAPNEEKETFKIDSGVMFI